MKKKNGFTLVELIAVIAILAVILTIGGISIVNVRKNVTEKDYDNLVTTIKIAAESYHEETGIDIVPVNVLLQTGKLQADSTDYENLDEGIHKGDPVIFNPIDGSPFNCAAVMFENGKVTGIDSEKGCSTEAIVANALVVYYQVNDGSTNVVPANNDDWIGLSNVTDKLTLSVTDNLKDATWISSKAPDVSYDGEKIEIPIPENGKIQETYTVSGKINGKYASNEFELRVDAKAPTIETVFVSEGDAWKNAKHIYADVIDNESKIKDYLIVKGSVDCTKDSGLTTYPGVTLPTIFSTVKEIGTYTVCARDNANHITTLKNAVEVKNVDTKSPKLTINVANGTTWKQSNTFTVKIQDFNDVVNGTPSGFNNETVTIKYIWSKTAITSCSGITGNDKITLNVGNSESYTSNAITISGKSGQGKIYACVTNDLKDRAGNSIENPFVSADMYLDNTNPSSTLSVNATNSSYNNNYVNIAISASDSDSGIDRYCYTTTNSSSGCDWTKTSSFSNVYTNATEGSGKTITYYAFVKDNAGNISSVSQEYKLYKSCTSTVVTSYGSYGSCSASCGGGKKSRTVYYGDQYLGTDCGTDKESKSCNTGSCYSGGGGSSSSGGGSRSSGGGSSSSGGSSCDAACVIKAASDAWPAGTSQADWKGGTYGGVTFNNYDDMKAYRESNGYTTNSKGDCTVGVTCK